MFIILFFASSISFIMLSQELHGLVILSGDYENIHFRGTSLLYGGFIILIVFIFTKWVYLRGVHAIESSTVLKTY
jgi:hypothetical protein